MKQLLLSALVLGAMSSAALAAEPLTEQQMDTVTAGQAYVLNFGLTDGRTFVFGYTEIDFGRPGGGGGGGGGN